MDIKICKYQVAGIKFYISEGGVEVARARFYLLRNDLHEEPFGYIEDIFTRDEYRGSGYASKLLDKIIMHSKKIGCYKLILVTSKKELAEWYSRHSFVETGVEMRIDFK